MLRFRYMIMLRFRIISLGFARTVYAPYMTICLVISLP